jgi:hypothetical protein
MNESARDWLVPVALVSLVMAMGVGLYWLYATYWLGPAASVQEPASVRAPAAPPPAAGEAAIKFPLPGEAPQAVMQAPAEPTEDALAAFSRDLAALVDAAALARFVGTDALVRRIVATADNLGSDEVSMKVRAVLGTPGVLAVRADGDAFVLDATNARRYEPLVLFLESIDARRAAELYKRHYRLFQGEYRGQGSPDQYFNDRLVASIDHLLATPEVRGPIRLVQPRVLYRFEDPALESLSAGQKAMIRIGPENAARLKARLRAVRAELVRQGRDAKLEAPAAR